MALVTFLALGWLIAVAGLLGIWLALAVVPALARFLVMIGEARAMGRDVEPPGIEYFSLAGSLWTLFPAVPIALVVAVEALAGTTHAGTARAAVAAILLLYPAMIGVLVITHSPLQSLYPVALWRFVRHVGPPYLLGLLLWALLLFGLPALPVPRWLGVPLDLYAAFAFHAVIGGLIREAGLLHEIDIPEAADVVPTRLARDRDSARRAALNHAYALASRGNLAGALAHVREWLHQDSEPDTAWHWYFENMLQWEDTYPALRFAQQYLSELLDNGDDRRAVKLMLRCRHADPEFRPLAADRDRAAAAAGRSGNTELAAAMAGPSA